MTTTISIHPHNAAGMAFFVQRPPMHNNANSVTLTFAAPAEPWPIRTEVTIYHLSTLDADLLALIGRMGPHARKMMLDYGMAVPIDGDTE